MDLKSFGDMLEKQGEAFEAFVARTKSEADDLRAYVESLEVKMNRDSLGGGGSFTSKDMREAKQAIKAFAQGDNMALKSMSGTSGPDGGFTVPTILSNEITSQLADFSPMRRLARVVNVAKGDYQHVVNRRGMTTGRAGENSTRSATATPNLATVSPPGGEIYAYPTVTNWLLQDSNYDLGSFITSQAAEEFALTEGDNFINGAGSARARGFLTSDVSTAADASRPFGTLQYIATGVSGDFAASLKGDKLIDLKTSLRPIYRQGPGVGWLMSSTTASVIQKFKDGQNNYLWREGLAAGDPATLLGYPVFECEDMPEIGADTFSVAFGNWQRGYLIVDKGTDMIIRDQITAPGFTKFYMSRRVHGSVLDSNAIKLLKFGTS